ncbi:hypothetical protein B0H17DRAFT_948651 [Mycena rosella]|uniref:HNH nuclease domain-containing protein n=1 Tax=Mycena rosella TaxID=1033263 RepID=A0AAD7D058_MYCRO|nr:hypothetical protein B0H17DRAFT_948651 [Mycena rosella]
MSWTPAPFDLRNGVFPFNVTYPHPVSVISNTEAFNTGLNIRDKRGCIVCGARLELQHCHIVPKVEPETWEDLRVRGFIPSNAKGVEHEARNGILMCGAHRPFFDNLYFYIRWVPEVRVPGKYLFSAAKHL